MLPERNTLLICAVVGLTPIAGVMVARYVGQGPSSAGAAVANQPGTFPKLPGRVTVPTRDEGVTAGLGTPFRIEAEPMPRLEFPAPTSEPPKASGVPVFTLTAVMPHATRPLAVINGRARSIGDEISPGWFLRAIDGDSRQVLLTGPEDRTVVLRMATPGGQ